LGPRLRLHSRLSVRRGGTPLQNSKQSSSTVLRKKVSLQNLARIPLYWLEHNDTRLLHHIILYICYQSSSNMYNDSIGQDITCFSSGSYSYMNSVHILQDRFQCFFYLRLGLPNDLFPSSLPTKMLYVDRGLLGCDAMWSCMWLTTVRRNVLPPSPG
jgi:hypothetical protein